MSPFLFIIMAEALGRLISRRMRDGVWKGVKVGQGLDLITHPQFANDTLLMGESSFWEARVIKATIDMYGRALGQCVNW